MTSILVAGAGKGIGKATADLAYEKGYQVIAVSRTNTGLKSRPYPTLIIDLEYPDRVEELSHQDPTAIINCTGTHPGAVRFGAQWRDSILNTIASNLVPALHLYDIFLERFRKSQAEKYFIHVSSGALDFYDPEEAGYCASKSALEAITLSLQNGESTTKVKHHALRVALTDTPLARRVCPAVNDWEERYTPKEIAFHLLDIIERPDLYPRVIIPLLYKPIRTTDRV